MTEMAAPDPLTVRVYLCRAGFHVWISAGPHHPRLLCKCGRVEWQNREGCLEREGPPIFVNGVEAGQIDLGPFVEAHIASGEYWNFEVDYETASGWSLVLLRTDDKGIITGKGSTLGEAAAALAANEGNSGK